MARAPLVPLHRGFDSLNRPAVTTAKPTAPKLNRSKSLCRGTRACVQLGRAFHENGSESNTERRSIVYFQISCWLIHRRSARGGPTDGTLWVTQRPVGSDQECSARA